MGTELQRPAATLPGLLPDHEADLLVRSFVSEIDRETGRPALPALPTAEQRAIIQKRADELGRLVRPLSYSTAEMQRASQAIAAMFLGYPSLRKANAAEMVTAYLMQLQDLPLFAVVAACEDVSKRRINSLDPNYPPSSPLVYGAAMKHAERHRADHYHAQLVLGITAVVPPVLTGEARERVAAKLAELSKAIGTSVEDERRDAQARVSQRARAFGETLIRDEYEAAGIKPLETGGMLISASLAKQLGALKPPRKRQRDDGER